jgi:putative copper resistance protein D
LITTTFRQPPAGWGVDPMSDQYTAGSIAWSFGELPTVLVLAVVLFSWMSSEERRGRRLDRQAERDQDAELAAYNAQLRALAARSEN